MISLIWIKNEEKPLVAVKMRIIVLKHMSRIIMIIFVIAKLLQIIPNIAGA